MELKRKYETAMKEKMLAGLERDKMAAKVGTGESLLHSIGTSPSCSGALSHNITGKICHTADHVVLLHNWLAGARHMHWRTGSGSCSKASSSNSSSSNSNSSSSLVTLGALA